MLAYTKKKCWAHDFLLWNYSSEVILWLLEVTHTLRNRKTSLRMLPFRCVCCVVRWEHPRQVFSIVCLFCCHLYYWRVVKLTNTIIVFSGPINPKAHRVRLFNCDSAAISIAVRFLNQSNCVRLRFLRWYHDSTR